MQVARFDGRTWAISARGFNISTANKLVVMIDGRSVYTPLFSGVFWDVQDVVLEDVDRIEVIRGPGATLWGANAVNGVINIVTGRRRRPKAPSCRSAAAPSWARPPCATASGWALTAPLACTASIRYRDSQRFETGASARDPLRFGQAGFRLETGLSGRTLFTLQGDAYKGTHRDRRIGRTATSPAATFSARVSHTRSSGSQVQLQAYYDGTYRKRPAPVRRAPRHVRPRLQYRTVWKARHDIVSGLGYQVTHGRAAPSPVLFFAPETRTSPLINVFVQDDIALAPGRVHLILGTKVEHNDYTGMEYQPSARLRWTTGRADDLGGGVARRAHADAIRHRPALHGRRAVRGAARRPGASAPKRCVATELGYRRAVSPRLSVDLASFVNTYDDLRTQEPSPPAGLPIVLSNKLNARTAGIEATAAYQAAARRAAARRVHVPLRAVSAGSRQLRSDERDVGIQRSEASGVAAGVHGSAAPPSRRTRYSGTSGGCRTRPCPRYAELTLRLGWRRGPTELSIVGDNLLHDHHPEFGDLKPREEYRRSAFGQVTWRF